MFSVNNEFSIYFFFLFSRFLCHPIFLLRLHPRTYYKLLSTLFLSCDKCIFVYTGAKKNLSLESKKSKGSKVMCKWEMVVGRTYNRYAERGFFFPFGAVHLSLRVVCIFLIKCSTSDCLFLSLIDLDRLYKLSFVSTINFVVLMMTAAEP